MSTNNTSLGELISLFYSQYLEMYGDRDVASVAAAASINDLLVREREAQTRGDPVAERDAA